jgi:uncharacterized Zn-finger protein
MAESHGTPHFHNQHGLPSIKVAAREFMCIGALPPFDHPHIFIDMGDETDIVCSYCSTRFVYDGTLSTLCSPVDCIYMPTADQAA